MFLLDSDLFFPLFCEFFLLNWMLLILLLLFILIDQQPSIKPSERDRPKRNAKLRPIDRLSSKSEHSLNNAEDSKEQLVKISPTSSTQPLAHSKNNANSSSFPSVDSLNLLHAHTIRSTSGQGKVYIIIL